MAAGISDRVWEIADVVQLLEPYKADAATAHKQKQRERIERSYNPYGPVLGFEGPEKY